MENDQDYGIVTIGECYVHLHDASNYAREALGGTFGQSERIVTTVVSDGALNIMVRRKGSLDGFMARVPLLGNYTDRVKPKHLDAAVAKLKSLAIKV